jgi:flagellar protein FliS
MANGDTFSQNDNLTKAERIVTELLSTLDMTQGGQVAENLFSLYTYVYDTLVEANIEDKPEKIDECVQIFSDLRESWVELERTLRKGAMGDGRAA